MSRFVRYTENRFVTFRFIFRNTARAFGSRLKIGAFAITVSKYVLTNVRTPIMARKTRWRRRYATRRFTRAKNNSDYGVLERFLLGNLSVAKRIPSRIRRTLSTRLTAVLSDKIRVDRTLSEKKNRTYYFRATMYRAHTVRGSNISRISIFQFRSSGKKRFLVPRFIAPRTGTTVFTN